MSDILRHFPTTAAREAYRFGANAIGRLVTDAEDGLAYLVYGEGLGADVLFPLDPAGGGGGAPAAHETSHRSAGSDPLSVLNLAGYPGGTSTFLRADGSFASPTRLTSVWDGRVVPTTSPAPTLTDEFATLDAAWLDYDHGAYVTHSVESPPGQLVSVGTGDGTHRCAGRYRAIPSNEFQFIAYVGIDCNPGGTAGSSGVFVGLAVFQDAASSTGDVSTIEFADNNPTTGSALRMLVQRPMTAYNVSGSTITTAGKNQGMWLRMRITVGGGTTTITNDWSGDGVSWQTCNGGEISTGYAAQHYGLIGGTSTGSAFRTVHRCFRMWSGAGAYGHNYALNGGYI